MDKIFKPLCNHILALGNPNTALKSLNAVSAEKAFENCYANFQQKEQIELLGAALKTGEAFLFNTLVKISDKHCVTQALTDLDIPRASNIAYFFTNLMEKSISDSQERKDVDALVDTVNRLSGKDDGDVLRVRLLESYLQATKNAPAGWKATELLAVSGALGYSIEDSGVGRFFKNSDVQTQHKDQAIRVVLDALSLQCLPVVKAAMPFINANEKELSPLLKCVVSSEKVAPERFQETFDFLKAAHFANNPNSDQKSVDYIKNKEHLLSSFANFAERLPQGDWKTKLVALLKAGATPLTEEGLKISACHESIRKSVVITEDWMAIQRSVKANEEVGFSIAPPRLVMASPAQR